MSIEAMYHHVIGQKTWYFMICCACLCVLNSVNHLNCTILYIVNNIISMTASDYYKEIFSKSLI